MKSHLCHHHNHEILFLDLVLFNFLLIIKNFPCLKKWECNKVNTDSNVEKYSTKFTCD